MTCIVPGEDSRFLLSQVDVLVRRSVESGVVVDSVRVISAAAPKPCRAGRHRGSTRTSSRHGSRGRPASSVRLRHLQPPPDDDRRAGQCTEVTVEALATGPRRRLRVRRARRLLQAEGAIELPGKPYGTRRGQTDPGNRVTGEIGGVKDHQVAAVADRVIDIAEIPAVALVGRAGGRWHEDGLPGTAGGIGRPEAWCSTASPVSRS